MRLTGSLLLVLLSVPAMALSPDNLLLVVNRNVKEGRELAEYYAQKRGVPEGRIVELDLPAGDDISFSAYETDIVPPLREFIVSHKLDAKVACVVLFFGVPLRIGARVNTPAEQQELATLREDLKKQFELLVPQVEHLEKTAKAAQPAFLSMIRGNSIEALAARSDLAARVLGQHIAQMEDPPARDALLAEVSRAVDALVGPVVLAQRRLRELEENPAPTDAQKAEIEKIRRSHAELFKEVQRLQARRFDPDCRASLRKLYRDRFGPLDLGRLLEGMIEYLGAANTEASVDSELACLGWGFYARGNWLANPLNWHNGHSRTTPIIMTARIDAPTPRHVRAMIDDSLKAEAQGLAGKIVIDSGGHLAINPKNPAYAAYDNTLRQLAQTVREKSKLEMVFDEKREVLPAGSARDVAIYTGWYAVRRYTPCCAFVPGAVAYHTASYEMCSLHNEGETGWCRGLLLDGAAATLGPVAEPYLHAFPPPNEFFPLLMTGKLTLAEVYWKTAPTVSWRMVLAGDPLYNPYAAGPALKVEDLPEALRAAIPPTTRAATSPAK